MIDGGEAPAAGSGRGAGRPRPRTELKQRALADTAVQAMLDVFTAEIRDVEEIEK